MRAIKGYEGLYASTEEGEIISLRTGKALKPYENTGGYMRPLDYVPTRFFPNYLAL